MALGKEPNSGSASVSILIYAHLNKTSWSLSLYGWYELFIEGYIICQQVTKAWNIRSHFDWKAIMYDKSFQLFDRPKFGFELS
jgi:hypothetical protein